MSLADDLRFGVLRDKIGIANAVSSATTLNLDRLLTTTHFGFVA